MYFFLIQCLHKCQTKSWIWLFSTLESTLQVIKAFEMNIFVERMQSFLISRNSILLVSFRYSSMTCNFSFISRVVPHWSPLFCFLISGPTRRHKDSWRHWSLSHHWCLATGILVTALASEEDRFCSCLVRLVRKGAQEFPVHPDRAKKCS